MKLQSLFIILILSFISTSLFSQTNAENKKAEEPTTYPESNIVSTLKTHSLGIGVGQAFLIGDFKDLGENEIAVDLYYSYAASYSFDFLVNLHYATFEDEDREISLPGLAFAIKAKAFQFDQFSPFVLGGLGFYKPQAEVTSNGVTQKSKSKITFGVNFGAGIDLRLNEKFSFGLLLHYHNPFDVKQDVGDPLEGSYSKIMITSTYTF